MPNYRHSDKWKKLFEERRQRLVEEGLERSLDVTSFLDLKASLQNDCDAFSRTTYARLSDKLDPGLRHIRSFANAITSASQYAPIGCLIWGCIQAAMVCASAYGNIIEEVVEVSNALNDDVPMFEDYTELFPDASELQWPLLDLFEDYLNFYFDIISYSKRRQSYNILANLWTTKPTTALEKAKADMSRHRKAFEKGAELAHRRLMHAEQLELRRQNKEKIQYELAADPLAQLPDESGLTLGSDVQFPIFSVDLFRNFSFLERDSTLDRMQQIFLGDSKDQNHSNSPQDTLAQRVDPSTAYKSSAGQTLSESEGVTIALDELCRTLPAVQKLSPICCVLHGLGGIGKSQVALEYAYRYRSNYEAIFWVQADRPEALAASFSDIAEKLGLTKDIDGHEGQNQSRGVQRAVEWLKKTSRQWLLVFDNVENIKDLNAYLPSQTATKGSVILTSQMVNMVRVTERFESIELMSLSRKQGARLLFKYLERKPKDRDEEETGREISDIVEGLPLALATIGGYIIESKSSPVEFLADMRTSSAVWQAGAVHGVEQYGKTLQTVFKIAMRQLKDDERAILNKLAFLNPDYIPESLFVGDTNAGPFLSRASMTEVVRVLRRKHLVRRDTSGSEPFLSVHRTVQWNVLLELSKDYEGRWKEFKSTFDLVRASLPETSPIDNPERDKWGQFEKYVPQVLSLRTHCLWPEPPVELPEEFAQVLSDMATFMWHAGLVSQGYDALNTADQILNDKKTPDMDPLRGHIHEHIGILASFHGVSQRREAMERRHKAIKARQAAYATIPKGKISREDEIRRFNVESDMAFGLMQEEDFEKSEEYIEKCHRQYTLWGTPDDIPFEYLKYNHIISYIRMSQKRPVDAIRHCKEAAKLGEVCAGTMHPVTQLCRFSLANHLYLAGELEESLALSKLVLNARSTVCGEYNPFTLESHLFCGFLLYEVGNDAEAENHLVTCLDRRKRSVWNREAVARAQYILSRVLMRSSKPGASEEAELLRNEALKTMEQFLEQYPEFLQRNEDPMIVFDQMLSNVYLKDLIVSRKRVVMNPLDDKAGGVTRLPRPPYTTATDRLEGRRGDALGMLCRN